MNDILSILIIAVLAAAAIVLFLQKRGKGNAQESSSLLMIQNQLSELRGTLDEKLGDSAKMFQQQYTESIKVIRDITERLTKLD